MHGIRFRELGFLREAGQEMAGGGNASALNRKADLSNEQAIARIAETPETRGSGVLTAVDVKAALKRTLGQDSTKHLILGTDNPALAGDSLSEELNIGLLLPGNVTGYEHPRTGRTVVVVIDPSTMVDVTGRDARMD